MNSFLSKIKSKGHNDSAAKKMSQHVQSQSEEENSLNDDQDVVFGGTLAIADESLKTPVDPNKGLAFYYF